MIEVYLGVDLGTKTGFCLTAVNPDTGNVFHHPWEVKLSNDKVQRHIDFDKEIDSAIDMLNHERKDNGAEVEIWYEQVHRHVGTRAAHVYGALQMQLLLKAHTYEINVYPVGVTELKKFATGAGNADKEAMIASAFISSNGMEMTDNEADAFWASEFGRCEHWVYEE